MQTDARRRAAAVVLVAIAVAAGYAAGAAASALAKRSVPFALGYVGLVVAMLWAARATDDCALARRSALVAALVFRLLATAGEPWFSDDVYRYVWDGRVQRSGVDPYAHAPDAPELSGLRDADWERINHREIRTIYPPLAQVGFRALIAGGAGPRGFRMAFGLLDFLTVLVLDRWLARSGRPRGRVMLYAWNPVAVIETAGSGHLEAAAVLLMVLAGASIIDRRPALSTLALAAGVQVKLVPLLLAPLLLRSARRRWVAPAFVVLIGLPIVVWWPGGTGVAPGTLDYAERWEHNAFLYAGIERGIPALGVDVAARRVLEAARDSWPSTWPAREAVERLPWPRTLARILVALLVLAWTWVMTRREELPLEARALAIIGGALWLSPTLHPWYLLWVLPWAALRDARPWLLWIGLVPLSYLAGPGVVPWGIRVLEHAPPLVWLFMRACRGWSDRGC